MTDRAVSVTLSYVLTLAITTILVTGLLLSTGSLVEDQRESAARSELRVVGERIAASLMSADRLAQSGATTVVSEATAPDRVAGFRYTVSLNGTTQEVVLETAASDIVVRVPFNNRTAVSESTATGGAIRIALTNPGDPNEALEVRSS